MANGMRRAETVSTRADAMCPPPGYIEINRRFRALPDSAGPEEFASLSYLGGALPETLTLGWDDLLKGRLVIVLGEPGSGKSWELRRRSASLQHAFLIELERLVTGDLVFAPTDHQRFQRWQKGRETACFFLDSVDEAKIRRQADFYTALDKVAAAVGGAMDRARFVISSRISEWQPETDRQEVLSRFGRPQQTDSQEKAMLVVQIEPLDRGRVRTFAEGRGIDNPERFLAELDANSAWEFARRPLDVIDLAEFWRARGRLGTLTEIIEHDVTTKLKETTRRHTGFPLSEGRARDGAEALAVATILCKRQLFKVPDDTFVAPDALDAARCLPDDWNPGEVAALLSRPLFDSATYGQIRFHHRRISEYLAAQWLRKRMSEGCSFRALEQLLFGDAGGTAVPRRTLIPVIAWLCNGNERWNGEIRSRVLRGAPEIHLEYGDAGALPLEFRRDMLTAWIERNRGREGVWSEYSSDAVRRLADPALIHHVTESLNSHDTPRDIREFLVQFVRYGRMTGCLPALIAILGNPAEPHDLKSYVLAALRDMGTLESHRQAWEILQHIPALTNRMRSVACEALYPGTVGPAQIAALLEKPGIRNEHPANLQHAIQRLLEERLTPEHAGVLIVELNRLLRFSPRIRLSNKETRISVRFEYLLEILPLVLTRLFSGAVGEAGPAAEALSLLAEAHPFHRPHDDSYQSLNTATSAHPRVRQCFFWKTVQRWRAEHPKDANYFLVMHEFRQVLNLWEADVDWMIADIQSRPDPADRLLMLRLAMEFMTRIGDRRLTRLQHAVSGNPELTAALNAVRSQIRWAWFYRLRYRLRDRDQWRHWWAMKRIRVSQNWRKWRDWWWLLRNKSRLRSGSAIGPLVSLCHEATRNESRLAPVNWHALVEKHGKGIAEAVKAGCKQAWHHYTPPLPHEREDPNEIDGRLIIGLVGIQSLIVDGELRFETASTGDVRLITRYAVQEMNGFPAWLQELAAARPGLVAEVLTACVVGEWEYPADRARYNDVLCGVAWEGGCLAHLVRQTVMDRLRAGDPAHPSIFDCALSLVVKTATLPDNELGAIAAARCGNLPLDAPAFPTWSAVCLEVNADQAITILEGRLRGCAAADEIVLRICEILGADVHPRLPLIGNPDYLRPSVLARLIPLVYRHIRPADDIDRSDGAPYSATPRDNASRFRTGLLSRLAQSEDPGATALLQGLLTCPELAAQRDWLLHLIDQRIVSDADYLAWEPAAIREFARVHETHPRTDGELFRIVLNRLHDIQDDVERSDNSLREEVQRGADEYALRRWFARKLEERAKQRYTIPQEEEIDQEERPDLRAENPMTPPVSIELKWADNWTLAELLERLENQLVGQYLRAARSRYGIYVLATDGRKGHWQSPDGNLVFDQIIERIRRRADELRRTHPGIGDLRVVSLDFRVPS